MASPPPGMASRRLARKPGFPNLASNLKESNSEFESSRRLAHLDVKVKSTITGTAGKFRNAFGSSLRSQNSTSFRGSRPSPTIRVDSLDVMEEPSDMHLQHASAKEKAYELRGKGHPISKAVDPYMHTSDWAFMSRARTSTSNLSNLSDISIPSHCPSLASGSTVSSRNSSMRSAKSTRSAKSLKWLAPERLAEIHYEDMDDNGQGLEWFDSLDSTPKPPKLPHENDRPHKCPIKSCQYHVRGFTKLYDRLRHTNTHFKGTLICGFCPTGETTTTKVFSREDVFSRHLSSVHGARHVSTKRNELYSTGTIKEVQKPSTGALVATCTQCSEPFDAQGFYEHLPGCTYRRVMRDSQEACREDLDFIDTDDERDSPRPDSPVIPHQSIALVPIPKLPSLQEVKSILQHAKQSQERGIVSALDQRASASNTSVELGPTIEDIDDMEELTASSRCLSLTSSKGINTSDEETDCTVDDFSPESETESVRVQPILSPLKRQLIDRVMVEFHSLFDQSPTNLRTHYAGKGSQNSQSYAESSHASSTGDSPFASRKRSLSGGGSTPPNDRRNDGDDRKRRRADTKVQSGDIGSELRFACPYYKRNPGRHQTFTSCRDPGFITVARLKEHLYRRHLLPIQCNRCCTTFANDPALREHQRDPQGCEVKDQVPIEGFDKDQERKLKSKKRSLVQQSEEDKWKGVYRILFPDDNDVDMPSPYIEYQPHNASGFSPESNIAHFQEFSRLQLPRLVRRTLEAVVEQEAQPLEEKLKERLVDIVEQCQSQLISMFQSIGGPTNLTESPISLPASDVPPQLPESTFHPSFHDFDSSRIPNPAPLPEITQHPIVDPQFAITSTPASERIHTAKPSNMSTNSGSPDSGYDSTWPGVNYPQDVPFDPSFGNDGAFVGLEGFYGLANPPEVDPGFGVSMWPFPEASFPDPSSCPDTLCPADRFAGGQFRWA